MSVQAHKTEIFPTWHVSIVGPAGAWKWTPQDALLMARAVELAAQEALLYEQEDEEAKRSEQSP